MIKFVFLLKILMMEKLYLLVVVFIILLLIVPIFIKLKFSYNLLDNLGGVGVYLFGIKITGYLFAFKGKEIELYSNKKNKNIEFSGQKKLFLEKFINQVKEKIKVKRILVIYNIGLKDAFFTSIACGYLNIFLYIIFSQIKRFKSTASCKLVDNIAYNNKVFDISINTQISISLFELVYSFLNSVILFIKGVFNYKS